MSLYNPGLVWHDACFPPCRPSEFENVNTLHQLRCGGVLEAVRISCAGYPTKTPYPDFVDHFWNLAPQLLSTDMDDEGIAEAILQKTGLKVCGASSWCAQGFGCTIEVRSRTNPSQGDRARNCTPCDTDVLCMGALIYILGMAAAA